ncbi:hypothetical protein BDR04DRAFT_1150355 [Suillus decipiens]|nr:hypothetical protein BDR04DRAFT_1150355 [Suillus decipiens]
MEHKLYSHVDTAIQQHNLMIQKLVSLYNGLCTDLSALIRQCHSPPNAIALNPISPAGIFDLDIDADMWQDIGLNDDVLEPSDWLADEATHAAIKLVLEIDWCNKEESRVKVERCALQRAHTHASHNQVLVYHMDCHAQHFVTLVLGWQMKVHSIPCAWPMPDSWRPSCTELPNGTHVVCPDANNDGDDGGEDRDDWESDLGCGNEKLMDVLEDIALAD